MATNKRNADTDLARAIRREVAAENPDAIFDLEEGKRRFIEQNIFDIESAKRKMADSAFRAISHDQPKLDGQLALPSVAPSETEWIPLGEQTWVHAASAKLRYILDWQRYEEEESEKRRRREMAIKDRVWPLMDYFIKGLTWAEAADAYQRDHPDASERTA